MEHTAATKTVQADVVPLVNAEKLTDKSDWRQKEPVDKSNRNNACIN